MKSLLITSALILLPLSSAQNAPAPSPAPASAATTSPARSVGMFVYPKSNQTPAIQSKDENECYASAKQNSGVDPQAPPPAAAQAQNPQNANAPKGGAVKGSAKGAAGGAAIGAITGDAGTGAAVGATAGAMAGRRQQKKADKAAQQQAQAAQQQAQQQATAQQQASLDSFKRAFSACLDSRGYSVQ